MSEILTPEEVERSWLKEDLIQVKKSYEALRAERDAERQRAGAAELLVTHWQTRFDQREAEADELRSKFAAAEDQIEWLSQQELHPVNRWSAYQTWCEIMGPDRKTATAPEITRAIYGHRSVRAERDSLQARLAAMEQENGRLRETLRSDALFLRHYLENYVVSVQTKDERGYVANSFAALQIPDWAAKQRLDDIDFALAAPVAQAEPQTPADGWLPIESAPTDGTPVLLGAPQWKFANCGWWQSSINASNDAGWTDGGVISWNYQENSILLPTHWRPLPDPPQTDKGGPPCAD